MRHESWLPYGGSAKLELALVLLALAAAVTILGIRLRRPIGLTRPSQPVVTALVATWIVAIPTFLVCFAIYAQQVHKMHPSGLHVGEPILPYTLAAAVVTFVVILIVSPDRSPTGVISAVIGAIAGPMVFELPFDLIVMTRTVPVHPDPALYRLIFFVPLFLIELTTLSFLTLCPNAKVARSTFFTFALMLVVFAGWALADGITFPNSAGARAFNVAAKFLAFGTVLTLFVPQRPRTKALLDPEAALAESHQTSV